MANRTKLDNTWQYSKLWYVYTDPKACMFKNHANLLTNLTKIPLYIPEDGFKVILDTALSFVWKTAWMNSCQTMAMCTMNCATMAHQLSAYVQSNPLYLLSVLYVIHIINHSPLFRTASNGKQLGAWEWGYLPCVHNRTWLNCHFPFIFYWGVGWLSK